MEHLERLAGLIWQRNALDREIAAVLGRPAHSGHLGEYQAAAVFALT